MLEDSIGIFVVESYKPTSMGITWLGIATGKDLITSGNQTWQVYQNIPRP
jgi:hypothetical protein